MASKEVQRQAVKSILKELSDSAVPYTKVMVQAMQEDWEEEKLQAELIKLVTPEALSKNFDYYTDRIMGVFEE